ncbi:MAG: hypothetical protein F6K10_22190 [Moorea sp. SIO2B7]|nr:hypothetical protein [Moorena sp. SIO2B7]
MRYVTSIERLPKEEGIIQKGQEDIIEILQTRFENIPNSMVETLNSINKISVLKKLFKRAITINSVAEFQLFMEETLSEV